MTNPHIANPPIAEVCQSANHAKPQICILPLAILQRKGNPTMSNNNPIPKSHIFYKNVLIQFEFLHFKPVFVRWKWCIYGSAKINLVRNLLIVKSQKDWAGNHKSAKCHICWTSANLSPQVCGFTICRTYLPSAHLCFTSCICSTWLMDPSTLFHPRVHPLLPKKN